MKPFDNLKALAASLLLSTSIAQATPSIPAPAAVTASNQILSAEQTGQDLELISPTSKEAGSIALAHRSHSSHASHSSHRSHFSSSF